LVAYCRVLINQPETVSDIAMKLPVGRIYASGKAFIPNIRRDLYDKISEAARIVTEKSDAQIDVGATEQSAVVKSLTDQADAASAEARCVSPVTSSLPAVGRPSASVTWWCSRRVLKTAGGRGS
jgi:hypothetical protein